MIDLIEQQHSDRIALVTQDGTQVRYDTLLAHVEQVATQLAELERNYIFLQTSNTIDAIIVYLASLKVGFPIALIEPTIASFTRFIKQYESPYVVVRDATDLPSHYQQETTFAGTTYHLYARDFATSVVPHHDLALLLTTSGSTSNPKLVRLTLNNIRSNALAIQEYLRIGRDDRSIQGLPIYYSYGMSLINSHLVAGGTVVLTDHSFMRPAFWDVFDHQQCTSFAGVPYMYETLHRLRFDMSKHRTLRTMTQAGGHLRPKVVQAFAEQAQQVGVAFFVMYGQTEAAPRISYVPSERLADKLGSIGVAIPGGEITLRAMDGVEKGGELIFRGSNVMLGYAESAADLMLGDECQGVLATGDLAWQDGDGYFYISGRLKRFAKLYGRRLNLSDVESQIQEQFKLQNAVVQHEQKLRVFLVGSKSQIVDMQNVRRYVAQFLGISPRDVQSQTIDELPQTSSGKVNYNKLSNE